MEDDLGWWYVGIAGLYAKTKVPLLLEAGNREEAIKLIRQIADYLEQDRKLGDNYQYRSPLLRRTTYEKWGDTADDRTQAEIILEELLTNAGYDEIRNEREFVEAVDKIINLKR